MVILSRDQMPEAEVALRLAVWLQSLPSAEPRVEVGIDGSAAQRFPVRVFLEEAGWRCVAAGGRGGPPLIKGSTRRTREHSGCMRDPGWAT